jgi:RNA polymerase sigma-70 factor (ECF subfamily)
VIDMDLLQEAKKSDKHAYNELVEKYNHIFYKTARVYFTQDEDIDTVLEPTFTQSYKELANVKNEREFILWTLRILISNCEIQKKKFEKDADRKINSKELTIRITDKISSSEAVIGSSEYQLYRKASIVEEYITSIKAEHRLPALLYFYADLSIQEIAKLLKISQNVVTSIIDENRIKIYEMIKNKEVYL